MPTSDSSVIGNLFNTLLVIFAGVLLGVVLRGASRLICRVLPITRRGGVVLTLALAVIVIAAMVIFLAPRVTQESDDLIASMPHSIDALKSQLSTFSVGRWAVAKTQVATQWLPDTAEMLRRVGGVVTATFGTLGLAVVVFFVGLYIALDPELYARGVVSLLPKRHRERARDVMHQSALTLQQWMLGQLFAMAVIGIFTYTGLKILGIEFAFVLALLAALLNFIPNIGPLIAVVPAAMIGLLHSPMTSVWVMVLYLASQTVESYMLTPMVQKHAVDLPPALTIVAQLILGVLLGAMGIAMAAPLTAVTLVIVRMVYVEDVLGDRRLIDGKPPDDPPPGGGVGDDDDPELATARRPTVDPADEIAVPS